MREIYDVAVANDVVSLSCLFKCKSRINNPGRRPQIASTNMHGFVKHIISGM